jgi:formylglycine-generating enzyme required for sulfatase activity
MATLVSRADLIYLLAREGEEALEKGASLAGYCPVQKKVAYLPSITLDGEIKVTVKTTMVRETQQKPQFARYWRVSGYRRVDEERRQNTKPDFGEPFAKKDLLAPEDKAPPIKTPLMPWSRLDPFLRGALSRARRGTAVDIKRLISEVAKVKPIRRLPRITRRGWAPRAQLLVDRDQRLTPFWDDQSAVYERLRGQRGLAGLEVLGFSSPPKRRESQPIQAFDFKKNRFVEYRLPAEGTPILLLGECGYLRPEAEARYHWQALGARLFKRGCRPVALAPCPRDRWPIEANRSWIMAAWDRFERCPVVDDAAFRSVSSCRLSAKADTEESREESADRRRILQERARRLLSVLSVAVRIEPALLRDARRLFKTDSADAGTEADAWYHESVQVPSPVGLGLDPKIAQEERKRLARFVSGEALETDFKALRNPERIARDLRELLIRRHTHLPEVIRLEERGYLNEVDPNEEDLSIFEQGMKRMTATLDKDPTPGRGAWCFRFSDRLSKEMRAKNPELANQWALASQYEGTLLSRSLPDGWDPAQIAWAFEENEERYWRVWQHGVKLVIAPDKWRPGNSDAQRGSPIGGIATARSFVRQETRKEPESVEAASPRDIKLLQGQAVDIGQPASLHSEWESLEIEPISKPDWASEIGRDGFGLYADFTYQGVVQRMRWINPGTFLMGSPEDEPGRYDNERQHRVTLTRGYWLADTPCTQALWQAVTGKKPSRFQSPDRPVEQVSWDDCKRFLDNINAKMTGLELRLPTEAEWEYACRAGTTTALYSGPIDILGDNNAPALNLIAWYGGNSGVDFELDNGYDSSEWQNKQYQHKLAGTHPVKRKDPNGWRIYDMLGNIWEWCEDWYRDYPDKAVIDPIGPKKEAGRVLRGGGWFSDARHVRSACRSRIEPGIRLINIGFRFARGQ